MKKFLTVLAVSTLFLSAMIISKGFGYSNQEGCCHEDPCRPVRKTTNRIFSFNQYNVQREYEKLRRLENNINNRFNFWRNYNYQISRDFNKDAYSIYKSSHSSLFPRRNNTLPQPHKLAVRETAYHQNYKWDSLKKTYSTRNKKEYFAESADGYTVIFPVNFIKTDANKYYDAQRDLIITTSRGSDFSCGGLNFQLCASQRGTGIRENRNLGNIKDLSQKFGSRQVLINGETVLFPTYRESFIATESGYEQVYFFYTTMNPYNQNVVDLEGIAPAKNKFASSNLMNGIFRTIQL